MKRAVCLFALCAFAGCTTRELIKSTPFCEGDAVEYVGTASDRVNLWPLAYWRNPVGSFAWPIASFSDDHFALRPVYSQYRQTGKSGAWDEFNFLWPIVQLDLKSGDGCVFPYCWGNDRQAMFPLYWNGPDYNALLPLWYYGSDAESWSFNTLAGLAGARRRERGYRCSWAFPLWFEDSEGMFATLLYGQTPSSRWLFPLWYKNERTLVSPFWSQGETDGGHSWWTAPLTLSWGFATGDETKGYLLFAFGGWEMCSENGRWWAWPFADYVWQTSPACANNRVVSTETYAASRLVGWKKRGDELTGVHAFPIFDWNENGTLATLLGGRMAHDDGATNKFVTPFFGVTSGKRTGCWAFPLWDSDKHADFDQKVALIDSPTLPDCVKVSVVTNANPKAQGKMRGATKLDGNGFRSSAKTTSALIFDFTHSVVGASNNCYGNATNVYEIAETRRRGNELLFNCRHERKALFDLKTRAKLSDVEECKAAAVKWLYDYEWNLDRMRGGERTCHTVLWRLWNWENVDGDVSLDVFPGFTYDSRKDGYSKTSFLWRFFRHEREPNGDTSVDFLFVPIWR